MHAMQGPLPPELFKIICLQAEKEYPAECCGVVLSTRGGDALRVRPCRNAQDEFHARDPDQFPRTSRAAYFMEPSELLALHKEAREAGEEIRLIYHSHVDAPAVFSEEDTRMALDRGEPLYPGVRYLVLSVVSGSVREAQVFAWEAGVRRFVKKEGNFHAV
jgi:[CysO sulfur-carrier protein]-S-L-cysteine hydrolase